MEERIHEYIEDFLGDAAIRVARWNKRLSVFVLQALYIVVFCLAGDLLLDILSIHLPLREILGPMAFPMLVNAVSCAVGYRYNHHRSWQRPSEPHFLPFDP